MCCLHDSKIEHATILNAYEERADSYSRLAVVQRNLGAWLAEWLEDARTAAWHTAVEFGAGDGLFTRFAAERYATYMATDSSPRMVQQGRWRLPHVDWYVADAWSYTGPTVDRIFSASLLQWCPEPVSILRKWRERTNRGGRMLHGFYVTPTLTEWQSIHGERSPLVWRTAHEWEQILSESGWKLLRSEARTHVQTFPSGVDFIRFLRHTGATCCSNTRVSELRKAIRTYEHSFPGDGAGGVTSTWTFFRFEAENYGGRPLLQLPDGLTGSLPLGQKT